MSITLRLAWRNNLRNKRRTLLASLAIGVGLAALIFTDGLILGMSESMVRTATDSFMGHGQIHARGFRTTYEVSKTIGRLDRVLEELERQPEIEAYTLRTVGLGMISSSANASSGLVFGIDPETERLVSRVDEAIVQGAFLDDRDSRRILLGVRLAETMDAEVGDRIVVTVAQARTGELAQEMFRVAGIFEFGSRELDGGAAFVGMAAAQRLYGLGNDVHEIAIRVRDVSLADEAHWAFWERASVDGNEAMSWRLLMPQLEATLAMSGYTSLIVGAILFAVVALGIVNTLFMSLYERMFEFGVLRALGTRPWRMAGMIVMEAGSLAFVSIVVGGVLGFGVTWYFSVYGIDYTGIQLAGVTFSEFLYPVIRLHQYTLFPAWVFVFTLLAAIYPAVYAARLTPARAMRPRD